MTEGVSGKPKYLVDLHTHSDISNGELPLDEHIRYIAERANHLKMGILALSFPEHNVIVDIREVQEILNSDLIAKELGQPGIIYIPGIELSTQYMDEDENRYKPHILCYGDFVDKLKANKAYMEELEAVVESRNSKVRDLCELIDKHPLLYKNGTQITVSYKEIQDLKPDKQVTMEGIARIMKNKINAKLRQELSLYYEIDKQSKPFQLNTYETWRIFMRQQVEEHAAIWNKIRDLVPEFRDMVENGDQKKSVWSVDRALVYFDTKRAIEMIHDIGGLAILAHPGKEGFGKKEIRTMAGFGLEGFEFSSVDHNKEAFNKYMTMMGNIEERSLDEIENPDEEIEQRMLKFLGTGGSNWHGPGYNPRVQPFMRRNPTSGVGGYDTYPLSYVEIAGFLDHEKIRPFFEQKTQNQ